MSLTYAAGRAVLKAFCQLLVLLALVPGSLLAATPNAEQSRIRAELAVIVEVFNTQARDLDTTDAAAVEYLNGFISSTLSQHWDTDYMARHLLGNASYASLDTGQQLQLRQTLEATFYRYAYEVIEEYKQAPMVLGDDFEQVDSLLRINLRANGRFLPAMTGKLYLVQGAENWVIVDAGYSGLTYNMLKRKLYQRKFSRSGFEGLTAWLDEKNQRFFADFCAPEMVQVMPGHIAALCDPG
jgi:ABC-type transporter MlaC component